MCMPLSTIFPPAYPYSAASSPPALLQFFIAAIHLVESRQRVTMSYVIIRWKNTTKVGYNAGMRRWCMKLSSNGDIIDKLPIYHYLFIADFRLQYENQSDDSFIAEVDL